MIVFISIPVFQFIFLLLIILNSIYIVFIYILPKFYSQVESLLFFERESEVWDEIKIPDTIIELKEEKKRSKF